MQWKVFAEDAGTGLSDQENRDYGDGAHFGAHVHDDNAVDYAPSPPTLTYDASAPEVTLSEAQYRVGATNVSARDHDDDGIVTTWPKATFVIKAPTITKGLTDGTTNYVYVTANLSNPDDGSYVVNTTDTPPSSPSLKVAEIDTANDTQSVVNQNPDGDFDSLSTEKAAINQNNSVKRAKPGIDTQHSVVGDDGTWYALFDGSFYKSSNPTTGFDEVTSVPFSLSGNTQLHMTSGGNFIYGVGGSVYLSQDGGLNWSNVQSLAQSSDRLWSITENANGTILASVYSSDPTVWKSTDNGQSWTQVADSTDLDHSDHVHKIRFHPADPTRVIMSGGDGRPHGFHRSDDEGNSWTFFTPRGIGGEKWSGQMVGIGLHPTDSSIYYLSSDSSHHPYSVFEITDNGGSDVSVSNQIPHNGNWEFTIRTIKTIDGEYHYLTSEVNKDRNYVWSSLTVSGNQWAVIDVISGSGVSDEGYGWRNSTVSQGPNETILDVSTSPYILSNEDLLYLPETRNPIYGSKEVPERGVKPTTLNRSATTPSRYKEEITPSPIYETGTDKLDIDLTESNDGDPYDMIVGNIYSMYEAASNLDTLNMRINNYSDAGGYTYYHKDDTSEQTGTEILLSAEDTRNTMPLSGSFKILPASANSDGQKVQRTNVIFGVACIGSRQVVDRAMVKGISENSVDSIQFFPSDSANQVEAYMDLYGIRQESVQ